MFFPPSVVVGDIVHECERGPRVLLALRQFGEGIHRVVYADCWACNMLFFGKNIDDARKSIMDNWGTRPNLERLFVDGCWAPSVKPLCLQCGEAVRYIRNVGGAYADCRCTKHIAGTALELFLLSFLCEGSLYCRPNPRPLNHTHAPPQPPALASPPGPVVGHNGVWGTFLGRDGCHHTHCIGCGVAAVDPVRHRSGCRNACQGCLRDAGMCNGRYTGCLRSARALREDMARVLIPGPARPAQRLHTVPGFSLRPPKRDVVVLADDNSEPV